MLKKPSLLFCFFICCFLAGGNGYSSTLGLSCAETFKNKNSLQVQVAPPSNAPYIALGFFMKSKWEVTGDLLAEFSQKMYKDLNHPVTTYFSFENWGYKLPRDPYITKDYVQEVKEAIDIAVQRAPGHKMILFNLDGFDVEFAFGQPDQVLDGYTNREAFMILTNTRYFEATRWFREGGELSSEEVKAEFERFFPELFN